MALRNTPAYIDRGEQRQPTRTAPVKSYDTTSQTAQRRRGTEPDDRRSIRSDSSSSANRLAPLQGAIDRSPRMVAQRASLQAAFGSAARFPNDGPSQETPLQRRSENAP